MTRAALPRAVVALVIAVAAAATVATPASAAIKQVQVTEDAFVPAAIGVQPGDGVTWTYPSGGDIHSVTFDDGAPPSMTQPLGPPWTRTRTFTAPGIYRYYCLEHGGPGGVGMAGIVYVNATGTVPGPLPTASFTVSSGLVTVDQNVTLNASASGGGGTPPDNAGFVRYEWDLDGDGSFETDGGTLPTQTASYTTPGTRTVGLRFTDRQANTATTTRQVAVTSVPSASFTVSPGAAQTGQSVSFDASASSDADGSIARFEWDLDGDGTFETDTGRTATTTRAYPSPGDLTISLRVTDNLGVTALTTRGLQVTAAAAPPPPPPPPAVPPPPAAPAGDTSAPAVRLTGSTIQKAASSVVVRVACPSEPCTAVVAATVRVPTVGRIRTKTFRLRSVTVRLAQGPGRSVALRLSTVTRSAILRALRARRSVSASFTVTVSDAAANRRSVKRTVRFRR